MSNICYNCLSPIEEGKGIYYEDVYYCCPECLYYKTQQINTQKEYILDYSEQEE